jgi:hypothetical protein
MIAYPAESIMDHKLIHDEMPEWNIYRNKSSLSNMELIIPNESASVQQNHTPRRPNERYAHPQSPIYDFTVKVNGIPAQQFQNNQPSINNNKIPE